MADYQRRSLFPSQGVARELLFDDDSQPARPLYSAGASTPKRVRLSEPPGRTSAQSPYRTPAPRPEWRRSPNVVFMAPEQPVPAASAACFDFDGVLVAKGTESPLRPVVGSTLRALSRSSVRLIITANLPIGETIGSMKRRVERFLDAAVQVPVEVYIAVGAVHLRKPNSSIVDAVKSVSVAGLDSARSWHCGASEAERRFAWNCGLHYRSAEEVFAGAPPEPEPAPRSAVSHSAEVPTCVQNLHLTNDEWDEHSRTWRQGPQEILVLVGMPAAGKSTLCRDNLLPHGYGHVNQDRLGSRAKCVAAVQEILSTGKRVVVDNTNPSRQVREVYLHIARERGVGARCIWLSTAREMCEVLNRVRVSLSKGAYRLLPADAFSKYEHAFESPTIEEGWDEIRAVHFMPKFESELHRRVFEDQRLTKM